MQIEFLFFKIWLIIIAKKVMDAAKSLLISFKKIIRVFCKVSILFAKCVYPGAPYQTILLSLITEKPLPIISSECLYK